MTPREVVKNTVRFKGADRFPYDLNEEFGSDFTSTGMSPSTDARPSSGVDEWGAVWENIGVSKLGEVKEYPLKEWTEFDNLTVPDIKDPDRWKNLESAREHAGDLFLVAGGISLYERVHFIRGLENTWTDIYINKDELCSLIDILVDMNLYAIEKYKEAGVDGYSWCDDWGLQDRLMISPDSWREIWKPRYARVYKAAHDAGLLTFLHSCGNIVSILDDLIEAGLDVIKMDQQQNMGLEMLGERFGGKITFMCPVDIQNTMIHGTEDEIRAYCRNMVKTLGRPEGGFIADYYSDPVGVGHREEAIQWMCEEFLALSKDAAKLRH
ncbi:uroporphyrinogen decarboxylase family protein [Planctomycetota bacterium]